MTWLDAFAAWIDDPANISQVVMDITIIACTIALIITVTAAARRATKKIERAINGEPVTGPVRTGSYSHSAQHRSMGGN